jgi:hypothetical protein
MPGTAYDLSNIDIDKLLIRWLNHSTFFLPLQKTLPVVMKSMRVGNEV